MASTVDGYLAAFLKCLPAHKSATLMSRVKAPIATNTRATYFVHGEHRTLKAQDIFSIAPPAAGAVLLIENIDVHWIATVGSALNVPPVFFEQHVANPAGSPVWPVIFGVTPAVRRKPQLVKHDTGLIAPWKTAHCWHVDGIFESEQPSQVQASHSNFIPRIHVTNSGRDSNCSTRVSCWKSKDNSQSICLVLVDVAPVQKMANSHAERPRMKLHLPLSNNTGGLIVPEMFGTSEHSLHDCLSRFFQHGWHLDAMFPTISSLAESAWDMDPATFFYFVVASVWEDNFRILSKQIKRISFEEIRRPTVLINDQLHDNRRDLVFLQEQVELALSWMPQPVMKHARELKDAVPTDQVHVGLPDEMLRDILRRAGLLEKFLMDSFNLLISSTSVMATELSVSQGIRGQRLTFLAFLYIPLSFVTGMFGMNIYEINGSQLSAWVPIVVLIITLLLTGAIFMANAAWERYRHRRGLQDDRFGRLFGRSW